MNLDHRLLRPRNLPLSATFLLMVGFTLTGLGYPFYVTRAAGALQILTAGAVVASALLGYYRPRIALLGVLFLAPVLPIPLKTFLGYDAILHLYFIYAALGGLMLRQRRRVWRFMASLDPLLLWAMLLFTSLTVGSGIIAGARYSPTVARLLQAWLLTHFTRIDNSYATVMSFVFASMNVMMGPLLFVALGARRGAALGPDHDAETDRVSIVEAVSALLAGACLSLLMALVQMYAPAYGLPLANGWPSGFMTDATAFGGTVALLMPMALAMALFCRDWPVRGASIATLALTALITIPLESRVMQGSILLSPFLLGAAWVAWRTVRGDTDRAFWIRIVAVATIGAIVAVGIGTWVMPGTELMRYVRALANPQMEEILEGGRDALARESLRMGLDYPIAGIGFGSFTWELLNYYELSGEEAGWFDLPHNFYLQVFAEMGAVGVTVLLTLGWALGGLFLRPMRRDLDTMKLGVYLGAAVASLMSLFALLWGPFLVFVEYQVVFWFTLYLVQWAGQEKLQGLAKLDPNGSYEAILSARASLLWLIFVGISVAAALLARPVVVA